MKYIIDVSKDRVSKNGKLQLLCEIENSLPQYVHTAVDAEPFTEHDRNDIEDEVWSFAWKIFSMDIGEYAEIFDDKGCSSDYREAKAKFEAWLKQKDEIHVGDEIVGIYSDGEKTPPLVVLKVEGNYYYGIYSKTGEYVQGGLNYEKTGRHFDEVEELLQKMKGEQDE